MPRRKKDIKNNISFTKQSLNKLKKSELINLAIKTKITLPNKNTKASIIELLIKYQNSNINEKTETKVNEKTNKKKRGRRAKSKLNLESIMANNNSIKETKNKKTDPNIIVHLSGITLDSIKNLKNTKDPLKYNPIVDIPKESSSIKENNFAWVSKNNKAPITSFSFLSKKNQEKNKNTDDCDNVNNDLEKTDEYTLPDNTKTPPSDLDKEYQHIPCIHTQNWYGQETTNTTMKKIIKEQEIEKVKKEPYNRIEKGRQNILREMQYANRTNKWPESVSLCCAWDFHEFNTRPIAIPTKIVDGVVHLEDVCCSLECAAAYIFCNEDGLFDDPSEIYSLLHYVYQQNEQINPAPSRRTLKERGGHYTIEEFRQLSANRNKTSNIVMPPFLSCIPIQEEVSTNIHINSAGITNMYIPVNKTRLDKASINIHEFRKKSSKTNNLGSYMNIVYK